MSDLMASAFATFLDHRRKKYPYHHNHQNQTPTSTPTLSQSTHHVLHPPLHPPLHLKRQRSSIHLNHPLNQTSPIFLTPLPLPSDHSNSAALECKSNTNNEHLQLTHTNHSPRPVVPPHHSASNQQSSPNHITPNYVRGPMIGGIPLLNYSNHSITHPRNSTPANKLPLHPCTDRISKPPITNPTISLYTLSLLKETSRQKPKSTTPRPFACHQKGCSASFIKQNHLSRHIRIVHNKERPYHCTEQGCGSRFGSKSHLADHTRAVHMRIKLFKCDMCNASWSKRFNLKKHIRVRHLGEKPYRCQHCHLSFGTRSHASRHELKVHKHHINHTLHQSKMDSLGI